MGSLQRRLRPTRLWSDQLHSGVHTGTPRIAGRRWLLHPWVHAPLLDSPRSRTGVFYPPVRLGCREDPCDDSGLESTPRRYFFIGTAGRESPGGGADNVGSAPRNISPKPIACATVRVVDSTDRASSIRPRDRNASDSSLPANTYIAGMLTDARSTH